MLITEIGNWSNLVRDCPPLWLPQWAKRFGEAGLLVGGGVMAPVVIRRNGDRTHVSSPPGEVGMCWASDPSRDHVDPSGLLRALHELGATSAFLKSDPYLSELVTELPVVELGASVEVIANQFSVNEMIERAEDRRRIWSAISDWPIELLTGPKASAVRSEFCAAYDQTMAKTGLTMSPSDFDELVRDDRTFVIVVRTPDGQFASAEMVMTNGKYGHVPFGVSADEFRKQSPSVKSLAFAIYLAADRGVVKLNLGGGLEPGDRLEWWKLRFGSCSLVPQNAVRWSIDGQESTETIPFPEWLEAA